MKGDSNYHDPKITINIGGERFMTRASTLSKLPGTRLSELSQDDPSYDPETAEYFFDRNSQLFPYILDAYRNGEIHFQQCICAPTVLAELKFWNLGDELIGTCCWKACNDWEEENEMVNIIDACYGGPNKTVQMEPVENGTWRRRMYKVWLFLDNPHSSKLAKVWYFIYLALLVLSTLVIILETCPDLRIPSDDENLKAVMSDSWNTSNPKIEKYYNSEEHPALEWSNHFCSLFFFVELMIRFLVCPEKCQFFHCFFNVIDILAIVPMFIFSIITFLYPVFWLTHNIEVGYNAIGLVAIFRAIRIMKIVKLNHGLQVIFLAVRASMSEILLLVLLLAIGMIIFSTAVYYAELQQPQDFHSIPHAIWWSIITLTTVGYGDMIPRTAGGQVIASICAMSGILIVGLPIPVIANNFRLFHTCAGLKIKLDRRALDKAAGLESP